MAKQIKVYAGGDTLKKWQKICQGFSSNTAAFAVVVENYSKEFIENCGDIDAAVDEIVPRYVETGIKLN
jgi:hypothetical protein